jgi:hypothetical protein
MKLMLIAVVVLVVSAMSPVVASAAAAKSRQPTAGISTSKPKPSCRRPSYRRCTN